MWGRFYRRFRQAMRRAGDAADVDPGCLDVIGEGIVTAIAVIVAVLVLVFVVLPLLVAVVDLAFVILLAMVGLAGRVAFRRPWTVEARRSDGSCVAWRVVGWRASGELVDQVANQVASGIVPPGGLRSGPSQC